MAVVEIHMRKAYNNMSCYLIVVRRKGMFLYSAVSSALDRSRERKFPNFEMVAKGGFEPEIT